MLTPGPLDGRETVVVSDEPPPSPSLRDILWKSRAREVTAFWFRPLLEQATWLSVAYLFVDMLAAIGFFVAGVAVGSTVFGLTFAGVGVLLYGLFFRMVGTFATASRAMAEWVGAPIVERYVRPIRGFGIRAVADTARWRQFGFLMLNVFIAPILFSVGTLGATLLATLGRMSWPLAALSGAFLLGAAPRLAMFVARVKYQLTVWFLGPDQLAVAQERVSALSQ